uniref:ATP synthase subunit a n=1 Tax=Cryptonome barbada TaxID=2204078 RepID=A0A343YV54_9ANNE|nr:ATP synthase F0 subunit 6 [Cryptonome barbada]AWN55975.1 ATP synthase F0 subunit 6 [Cryptonome barbada]
MLDIFSSFDPDTLTLHSSLSPLLFWALNTTLLLLISSSFWIFPTRSFWILHATINIMSSQLSRTFSSSLTSTHALLAPLFVMLIMINLMGLLPYVFSSSSHLLFTLSLGLPMWMALIVSSITNSPSYFAASLLPSGAPDWLNPFLVLIETVSILLRPITLSFRLAANMSAGHVVLTLAGIYTATFMFTGTLTQTASFFAFQTFYILFEMGICLIQAYIFCLLLSLYSDDHTA